MADAALAELAKRMHGKFPAFDAVGLDVDEDGTAVVFLRKGRMVAMMHPDDYRAICKRLGVDCAPLEPEQAP